MLLRLFFLILHHASIFFVVYAKVSYEGDTNLLLPLLLRFLRLRLFFFFFLFLSSLGHFACSAMEVLLEAAHNDAALATHPVSAKHTL